MHFVTGGAYNGKRAWVNESYCLKDKADFRWVSAYDEEEFPKDFSNIVAETVILEGIELWLKQLVETHKDSDICRKRWQAMMQHALQWEEGAAKRTIIFIGSDITRGIVPMDPLDRQWRDVVGWVFQDIANRANRIDIIWYGITTRLK